MTHAKPVESAPVGLAAPTTAELQALAESPLTAMRPQRSLWTNAFRRLRRNVMAMLALAYLLFMLVVAILAPVIAPHNPIRTDVAKAGTLRQAAGSKTRIPSKPATGHTP
jgi:ABC-type dipeptide/oligopeptide/nickel transport system permease subunit